jgi:DNA (cytosine-5)-methyltransferase 1
LFVGKVEEIEKDLLDEVNAFGFSMPCTNHSNSGKTKKGLKFAEQGDEVTALFGVVEMIKAVNPAIMFSENVPNARNSITYNILLKEITRLGYEYKEMDLDEKHGGCLELRKRYWIVIYSKGLNIDPELLMPSHEPRIHKKLGDVMTKDATRKWYPLANLQKRHDKNVAEGRNFQINLVDAESKSVSTVPRSYAKHQVANPHVTNHNGSYSLLTRLEHAGVKRVPENLVRHCSDSTAHQGLGQGISYYHAVGLAEQTIRIANSNLYNVKGQQSLSLT